MLILFSHFHLIFISFLILLHTGTPAYMAPEILPVPLEKKLVYGPHTDVFAFAIILWEIWAGSRPYVNENRKFSMWRKVCAGSRLPMHPRIDDDENKEEDEKKNNSETKTHSFQGESRSTWWPKPLVNLIERCWATSPQDRPTFEEIYTHWRELRADEKKFNCVTESANPWFAKSKTFEFNVRFNDEKIWKERAVSFEDGNSIVIKARSTKFNRAQSVIYFKHSRISMNRVQTNEDGTFEIIMRLTSKVMLGTSLNVCSDHTIAFRHSNCKQTMERFRHIVQEMANKFDKDEDEVCSFFDAPDEFGRTQISYACAKGDVEKVQELLEGGSSANAVSLDNVSAIGEAASAGHVNVVKLLLSKGVDPNRADICGWTPLHMAAQSGHEDVIKVLLSSSKIEPDLLDKSGSNALHRAARYDRFNVIRSLVQYNSKNDDNEEEEEIKPVIDMESKDAYGRTALMIASRRGNANFVRTMLENGADVDTFANNGLTVMTSAARQGHLNVVKCLIECGVNVDQEDKYHKTALHHACYAGHLEVVKVLIENGSNITHLNHVSASPLVQAVVGGHVEIVKLLLKHGGDDVETSIKPERVARCHLFLDIVKLIRDSKGMEKMKPMSRVEFRNYMKSIDGARQYFKRALKKEANESLYSSTYMSTITFVRVSELLDALQDVLVKNLMCGQSGDRAPTLKWKTLEKLKGDKDLSWVLSSYPLELE